MNKSTESLWDSAAEDAVTRMNQAWQWLREQRDNAPDGADSWDIRWQVINTGPGWLTDLTHRVLRGEYRLAPLQLQGKHENRKAVWGARDALVLKWAALSLQHLLPLHPACEHVKGHGGGKQSIMKLHGLLTQDACDPGDEKKTAATAASIDNAMPQVNTGQNDDAVQAAVNSRQYQWVCRTDIRGYYRNIDKQTLLSQVRQHVQSPVLRDLVDQYIHYTVEDGGTFHTPEKGISRGCPLSPLMGALHLYDMDEHFAKQANIHYARYMDDIIILAKSRWQLRRHTKRLMQWFKGYGFEAHPDKTFIGRTEKGFDWMGAWLTHEGVRDIAPRAKANHREKVRRLYERLARVPLWRRKRARQEVHAKVSTYRKRWTIWAGALVLTAGAACAVAQPLVILASGNASGDTGARYPVSVTSTWRYGVFSNTYDYGGACLSWHPNGCKTVPNWPASYTPMGWGWKAGTSKLVLIPHVKIRLSNVPSNGVAELDTATGGVRWGDGTGGTGCAPVEGDTSYRGSWYAMSKVSKCPFVNTDAPLGTTNLTGPMTADGYIIAYALGPLSPGTLPVGNLTLGYHSGIDTNSPVAIPDAIIISGLNCSMQVSNVTGAVATSGIGTNTVEVDLGDAVNGASPNTALSNATISMTTTCGGTNSSDAAAQVTVATSFEPGAGTHADATGFLRATGVTGHYLSLNQSTGSCNTSNAVTGQTTGKTYTPGAAGTVSTETVVASLCSDGTTATLGPHTIRAVAKLVNR